MSTDTLPADIPAEALADLEAVVAAASAGQKPDPELARRVRERSEKATEDIRKRCGEVTLAVGLVCQTRDEG